MSGKPVGFAGVTIILLICAYDMERETAQKCMPEGVLMGALVRLKGIVDAYAAAENKDTGVTDCAMTILCLN